MERWVEHIEYTNTHNKETRTHDLSLQTCPQRRYARSKFDPVIFPFLPGNWVLSIIATPCLEV